MRRSPKNIRSTWNHRGRIHYVGVLLFHEFIRVLQLWDLLAQHMEERPPLACTLGLRSKRRQRTFYTKSTNAKRSMDKCATLRNPSTAAKLERQNPGFRPISTKTAAFHAGFKSHGLRIIHRPAMRAP